MNDTFDARAAELLGLIHLPEQPKPAPAEKKSRSGSETRRMLIRKKITFTSSELADCDALAKAADKSIEDYLRDMATMPPTETGSGGYDTTRSHKKFLRFKSPEQVAEIEELANRAGLTFGSYIRARALNKPVTVMTRRAPVEKAELARLLGLLGNGTSNLNQIARQLNSDGEVALLDVREAVALMQEAARAVIETLGRAPKLRDRR